MDVIREQIDKKLDEGTSSLLSSFSLNFDPFPPSFLFLMTRLFISVHTSELIPSHISTPQTQSRIASMSKSFTAAAILRLRDEGALALDTPVASLVPEYPFLAPILTLKLASLFITQDCPCFEFPCSDRREETQ